MSGKPKRSGRRSAFNPQRAKEVLKALTTGMLLHDAAEFAGIHRDTLHTWIAKGERTSNLMDPYRIFSDEVRRARSSAKMRALGLVHTAMNKNWKAAAWWLSVTDPKHYSQRIRVTLDQEFADALARVSRRLPADVYEQVLDAILEDGGAAGEGPAPPGEGLEH